MNSYRFLGKSALKISPLTLGTMNFGSVTPDDEAFRIIDIARDHGVNSIDTADIYSGGKSEEVVGAGIKSNRNHWVLATKFVNTLTKGPNIGGYSRKWAMEAVENSLRRLKTDYIDIVYLHRSIFEAPISEPLRALDDLIRSGKVRYFALSNFRGWRIAETAEMADRLGMDRPVASQPQYNIVNRMAESEQIPAAHHYGAGVVCYSPLARGVLTGKYVLDAAPPEDSRVGRGDKRMLETEWRPESVAVAKQLAEHASAKGIRLADFALAWVLNNQLVTSVLAGPRTLAQWEGYLNSLNVKLDSEDEAFVDKLVSPGHPSTPGYNDPVFAVEGRKPRD
jgi:aryl-alcohol dehydrogenase-like predicted oxidoreductase